MAPYLLQMIAARAETASFVGRKSSSDEQLMVRFCDGDEGAFDALFDRHAAAVQAFLARIVRDPELARDLLQITFLSLVRSRSRYERGTAVGPWLFTIAANAARDALRHDKRVKSHAQNEGIARAEDRSEPVLPDPALRKHLVAALDSLSADQRQAVVLHKIEGWSFGEIARSAGITETAARIRAHRGYEKLRRLLVARTET